ncbi:unnamed protein product, partial [Allacma fusca]
EDASANFESSVTSTESILKRIFHFMTFDDLLSSARINKRWNKLSRWELRRNRKCFAKIHKDRPCQHLFRLKEQFQGKTLPFHGLSIEFDSHGDCSIVEDWNVLESAEFWTTLPVKIPSTFRISTFGLVLVKFEKDCRLCLKSLKISALHNYRCPVPKPDNSVILSSLTGHLIFSRIPGLNVHLATSKCQSKMENACCSAFDDLQNFATIKQIKIKRQL